MQLEHLFVKPVDRSIEGVIKADDDVALYVELDEYVITNEIAKRLDLFLDAYLNYQGANGVWVSGFFGSGKSHLLKMLALLLENKLIEDIAPLDVFLEKSPLNEGGMFANDLKRAVAIPSESILFNIDQKADVISKTEIDALIAVFVKVFDEHCGYYGKQAYIAQFERELDADGQFEGFKGCFQNLSGMDWNKGRARAKRMADVIDKAYTEASGQAVAGILDKYREDYRLSIEDFADQVKAYIDSKEPSFRLNFFVDEVGQYIADNVKLMTNLQTVAESLATKCNGQAWIIVTAQEEMKSVVGEESKQQSNDFTKIQARFKNRMKLTSQDVAEVIQLRLLQKREEYIEQLSELYHQQENNFKTLFDFADGSATYRNYRDREHFIQCYPFVPYQFTLFQTAIQNLSTHNAFEGKHSSVGERSMLGVFQQVAIAIKGHQLGELATFDLMFEGIRTALKTGIQQSILKAEQNLDNVFSIRLLKALFLVKYVKEFKSTMRNLCILMHDSFQRDIPSLKLQVEEALNLLEKETYIQRNGDYFEYLTDEEQDVEQEIKNTEVDNSAVTSELEKLIYDGVLKNRKIRWDENGQDYPFSKRLDDNLSGREYELTINIITSFHDHRDAFEKHKSDTVFNDELRIILPESERLVRDLILYKQTEKYVAHETRATQQDSIKRILADKASQNTERLNQLKILAAKLVGSAIYFVAGKELELSGEDGQGKMIRAFGELIKQSYPNLKMLQNIQYSENQITEILTQAKNGLFGEEIQLPEPQQEMLAFIQSNSRGGIRTTVKTLLTKFESKPYGWSFAAVLCTLSHLCGRVKVEVRESTNLLDDTELARALRNTATHGNLILDPQVEFNQSQIRRVKEFYNEYFDKVAHATEVKALAKEIQEGFANQAIELDKRLEQAKYYPFLRALSPIVEKLQDLKTKPYTWFMTELASQEDQLFDDKENIIDPILKFMKGPNKHSYDEARSLLEKQKPNLAYVEGDEVQRISAAMVNATLYQGNAVQQLKADVVSLQQKIKSQIEAERVRAFEIIDELKAKLVGFEEFKLLDTDKQAHLSQAFEEAVSKINGQSLIAMIRDETRRFEEQHFSFLIQQVDEWNAEQPILEEKAADPVDAVSSTDIENNVNKDIKQNTKPLSDSLSKPLSSSPSKPPSKAQESKPIVSLKQLKTSYARPWINSEKDVDEYLTNLRQLLQKELSEGKKIQVY